MITFGVFSNSLPDQYFFQMRRDSESPMYINDNFESHLQSFGERVVKQRKPHRDNAPEPLETQIIKI